MKLIHFDSEFRDLTDYIIKITHRIWEERKIGKIRTWYKKDAPVYTPSSVSNQVEQVVQSTLQMLHMFPDRKLFGEDVITHTYDHHLYYSSHRILSTMTHLGDGFFGVPTGHKVKTRVIADCVCHKNQVIQEWMVRDQSAIVLDLGLEVEAFGRAQGRLKRANVDQLNPLTYIDRWKGDPFTEKLSDCVQEVVLALEAILTRSDLDEIYRSHDRSCNAYFPGATYSDGVDQITEYLSSLIASFPKSKFELHHWMELRQENQPVRISIRWTLSGNHCGYGRYGPPSQAPVTIMAISHLELRKNKIYRAFHLFDEISIWEQIEIHSKKNS